MCGNISLHAGLGCHIRFIHLIPDFFTGRLQLYRHLNSISKVFTYCIAIAAEVSKPPLSNGLFVSRSTWRLGRIYALKWHMRESLQLILQCR